ncbi:peptide ABC transporter permease [Lentibacillus saliphilus]|uniref:peptide ABC transporter permease n=1 Tax=Lentibacillus saliphilus TaxID=2737028 RepID=UPI001C2F47F0|nr:peptide ABC transporter permease [Lentibacillus saliphilus]
MRQYVITIKRHALLLCGLLMLTFIIGMAIFGPSLSFIDENLEEVTHTLTDGQLEVAPFPPSREHVMGTDRDGRDILSLIVMGASQTLLIVCLVTVIRYLVAIPLAYMAHKRVFGIDTLVKSLNHFLSYVPTIIIVVILAMLPPIIVSDARPFALVIIIALVEAGRAAHTMKLDFNAVAEKEFMLSGAAVGASSLRMLKAYYLPFLYQKLIIYVVSDLGKVMFLLGQLGFIGVFVSQELVQVEIGMFELRNESITWPMLLMDTFMDLRGPVWIIFWPACVMTVTIFTFNMIAQGLQQLPKKRDSFM